MPDKGCEPFPFALGRLFPLLPSSSLTPMQENKPMVNRSLSAHPSNFCSKKHLQKEKKRAKVLFFAPHKKVPPTTEGQ
jgi:hypothetical protein